MLRDCSLEIFEADKVELIVFDFEVLELNTDDVNQEDDLARLMEWMGAPLVSCLV